MNLGDGRGGKEKVGSKHLSQSVYTPGYHGIQSRGGRGGEISRAKTSKTINYFIVKFITINEKVLIKPNFAGINFKDISSHF